MRDERLSVKPLVDFPDSVSIIGVVDDFSQFREWGRVGGKIRQRRLLKAKNRRKSSPVRQKPIRGRGRPKGSLNKTTSARNLEMKRLFFTESMTLEDIGNKFDVTRERVRQILQKQGVENTQGGRSRTVTARLISESVIKAKQREEKRARACQNILGCSPDVYEGITGKRWNGSSSMSKSAREFYTQRRSAKTRGIGWSLTFPCEAVRYSWWSPAMDKKSVEPTSFEITSEMIEAGVAELKSWETSDNPYWEVAVRAIYLAMRNAERTPTS